MVLYTIRSRLRDAKHYIKPKLLRFLDGLCIRANKVLPFNLYIKKEFSRCSTCSHYRNYEIKGVKVLKMCDLVNNKYRCSQYDATGL
jgi:hypothetical protein